MKDNQLFTVVSTTRLGDGSAISTISFSKDWTLRYVIGTLFGRSAVIDPRLRDALLIGNGYTISSQQAREVAEIGDKTAVSIDDYATIFFAGTINEDVSVNGLYRQRSGAWKIEKSHDFGLDSNRSWSTNVRLMIRNL
ncbi:MAG: hypothetical protein WCW36_02535 [Candidatus Paceibacterota bacterium]|jgi:hypothetical protein